MAQKGEKKAYLGEVSKGDIVKRNAFRYLCKANNLGVNARIALLRQDKIRYSCIQIHPAP